MGASGAAAQESGQISIFLEQAQKPPVRFDLGIERLTLLGEGIAASSAPLWGHFSSDEISREQRLLLQMPLSLGIYTKLIIKLTTARPDDSTHAASSLEVEIPLELAVEAASSKCLFLRWQPVTPLAGDSLWRSDFTLVRKKLPPQTSLAYVSNEESNNVAILDRQSGAVAGCIAVGDGPRGMAISRQRGLLYVANSGSSSISVIDVAGQQVRQTVNLDFGDEPETLCLNAEESVLWVGNKGSSSFTAIDALRFTTLSKTALPAAPQDIIFDDKRNRIFIAGGAADAVYVYNVSDYSLFSTMQAGSYPIALEVNPRQDILNVGSQASHTISQINAATLTVVRELNIGGMIRDLQSDLFADLIYCTLQNLDLVAVVQPTLNVVLTEIPTSRSPGRLALDSEGSFIYVCCGEANCVDVIGKNSGQLERSIAPGIKPYMVIFP